MKKRMVYRKKKQNRLAVFLVMLVVAVMLAVVSVKGSELWSKQQSYQAKIDLLEEQIAEEKERAEEIEEYRVYTQTKKYVEEVAREKLGLVNEGEIIYKPED